MIAIGTLREPGADVLVAAIDAGVDLIDTADVYGGAERAIAEARARRPEARVTVVTKGGLVRPAAAGPWAADGRARHLVEAAAASAARLGAPPDVYLLHAVDPKVPLATSVRALVELAADGVVRRIGVGNVRRAQLEEALAIAPDLAAVEVELSPWDVRAVRGGVVALCAERGIPLLAYRPLGGPERARKLANDAELRAIGERVGGTPQEVVLAWLRTLAPGLVPLPGVTRAETAASAARAARLVLDDDARRALDARWLGLVATGGAAPRGDREVVLVMGIPGAGKSSSIGDYVARGFRRLNRDERGGTLDQLARALDAELIAGGSRFVLDNTYPTRSSRAPVIAAARRHGASVRCVWLDTPIEDAQHNAARRLLERHGRLLEPEELRRLGKRDPTALGPNVLFRWRRELEPPAADEGFDAIEIVPFARRPGAGARRGVVLELDDVVRRDRESPDVVDAAIAAIARARADGWHVVATAWQPGPRDAGAALLACIADAAGGLAVAFCHHPAGPPVCWCRKPLPGLGLLLARDHDLDLARSIHVGRSPADRGFAARLGVTFVDADDWL